MKKTISLFAMVTGCLALANFSSVAQNTSPENKPMKSAVKPESAINSAPATPTLQKSNEPQNARPIVPGGEFKPMDTRMPESSATKVYDSPKPIMPRLPTNSPVPAPVKKDPVRPAPKITEQ